MIRMILKIALPVVAVAVGIGLAIAVVQAQRKTPSETPQAALRAVSVQTLEPEDWRHELVVNGTVQPRTETTLVAELNGRVLELSPNFVAGGFVEEGDVLMQLDPATYEANVATAEAELARAQALLVREKAEAELSRKEWAKYGEGEPGDLVLRKPQIAEAEAAVKSASARLRRAGIDLERVTVRAPYRGRVRERLVDEGQYLVAGTRVAVIYATDYAEVRLPISSQDTAYVYLPLARETSTEDGIPVELRVELQGATHVWPARITRTEGEIDPRTRFLYAIARVEDPYNQKRARNVPPLLVGMFVEATILGNVAKDVCRIPRSALRADDQIWLVDREERLRVRPVDVIRREAEFVVIGGRIEKGERLCLTDLDVAVDGMQVRVVSEGG